MNMKHEIYMVHAIIVDSNGNVSELQDYPVKFDSTNYDHDLEKTLNRAKGKMQDAGSKMSVVDTRQVQHAYIIRMSDGLQIEKIDYGTKLPDIVVPDPEPEPEPEDEPVTEG